MKLLHNMQFNRWSIDWPNHTIGFFSALFGILIAFELEEWRDSRNNEEEAREAFNNLKQEILINKNSLHETVATNRKLLEQLAHEIMPHLNENLYFEGELKLAQKINSNYGSLIFVEITDSTTNSIKVPVNIFMNSLVKPPLHFSAWESAKASGVINHIEYEKVLAISYLYNTPNLTEELQELRLLLRKADSVNSKTMLRKIVTELIKTLNIIENELVSYDGFANIVEGME